MGKNYLVIGASSGIGEACVRELASEENVLIIVARRGEMLQSIADDLPGRIIPFVYDLHDLEHIKDIFSTCKEQDIKLDGMVYSAGIDGLWPIKANSIPKMREIMDVNCLAFAEAGKCFFSKRYSNDGASIVAISSIASIRADKGMMAYAASKAALNSIVRTMAVEFATRKIRVNAILPAGVDTPMARAKQDMMSGVCEIGHEKNQDSSEELIPPDYIAKQVGFLLSDKSLYITGECLTVNGGMIG